MGRPKVDAANRLRTVQACDLCKRRKTKCDGKTPCEACVGRDLADTCGYRSSKRDKSADGNSSSEELPSKQSAGLSGVSSRQSTETGAEAVRTKRARDDSRSFTSQDISQRFEDFPSLPKRSQPHARKDASSQSPAPSSMPSFSAVDEVSKEFQSTILDDPEQADYHQLSRVIEDSKGRLIYIGESANIAFIHLLRTITEKVVGPNSFSADPNRHRLTEPELNLPSAMVVTGQLPDRETAGVLIEYFFTNTHGVIELFNSHAFLATLDQWYHDPMKIERTWLSKLFLVMACGFCLATPRQGARDAKLLSKLPENQGDIFYARAKSYSNPLVGAETAGFWAIQALTLISFYMLCRSKQNTAFAFVGIAIQSAYALGLHREESSVMFETPEQQEHRMAWRSLFVLDRFLATSLGRPCAIAEEESSWGGFLQPSEEERRMLQEEKHRVCSAALDATVIACHNMGLVLSKMYRQRRVSTRDAQELAETCKKWIDVLPAQLRWDNDSTKRVGATMAILHCYLAHYHSIMLLARPFFISQLSNEVQRTRLFHDDASVRKLSATVGRFATACVTAAKHSITIIYTAYTDGVLPRLDPFSIYSINAAGFILCANEFAFPYLWPHEGSWIEKSIELLRYCGELDPSARESAKSLQEFQRVSRSSQHHAQPEPFGVLNTLSPGMTTAPNIPPPPPSSSSSKGEHGHLTASSSGLPQRAGTLAAFPTLDPLTIPQPEMPSGEDPMLADFGPLMDMSFESPGGFGLGDFEQTMFPAGSSASSEATPNLNALWPWNLENPN